MKQIGAILRNEQFGIEGILVSRVTDKEFVIATRNNTCIKVPMSWDWVTIGKVNTTKALCLYEKFLEFKCLAKNLWENEWEEVVNNDKPLSFFRLKQEVENGNTLE